MGVDDALTNTDDLLTLIEDYADQLPARGQEFFSDVHEKALSVRDTILRTERCTDRQATAILNWTRAVEGWTENCR